MWEKGLRWVVHTKSALFTHIGLVLLTLLSEFGQLAFNCSYPNVCRFGLVGLGALGWDMELLGMLEGRTLGILVIGGELEDHSVHNLLFV